MTNEAVVVELLGNEGEVIDFTVDNATGIEKGTIMQISGASIRRATASSVEGEIFAGIAAAEKVASDGSTRLPCYTYGIFDLKKDAGTNTVGEYMKISGANIIGKYAATDGETGKLIGKALEDGATSDTIQILVGG